MFKLQLPIVRGDMHIVTRRRTGNRPVICKREIFVVNSCFFTGRMADTNSHGVFRLRFNRMALQTQLIQVCFHFPLRRTEYESATQFIRRSNMTDRTITTVRMGIDLYTLRGALGSNQQKHG